MWKSIKILPILLLLYSAMVFLMQTQEFGNGVLHVSFFAFLPLLFVGGILIGFVSIVVSNLINKTSGAAGNRYIVFSVMFAVSVPIAFLVCFTDASQAALVAFNNADILASSINNCFLVTGVFIGIALYDAMFDGAN